MKELSKVIIDVKDAGENIVSISQDISLLLNVGDNDSINIVEKLNHVQVLLNNILSIIVILNSLDYNSLDNNEEFSNEVRKIEFSCFDLRSLIAELLLNTMEYSLHENEIKRFIKIINMAANRIITLSLITKYNTKVSDCRNEEEDFVIRSGDSGKDNNFKDKNTFCPEDKYNQGKGDNKDIVGNEICQPEVYNDVCYTDRAACEKDCEGVCFEDKCSANNAPKCPEYTESFSESPLTHIEGGYYEQDQQQQEVNNFGDRRSKYNSENILSEFAREEDTTPFFNDTHVWDHGTDSYTASGLNNEELPNYTSIVNEEDQHKIQKTNLQINQSNEHDNIDKINNFNMENINISDIISSFPDPTFSDESITSGHENSHSYNNEQHLSQVEKSLNEEINNIILQLQESTGSGSSHNDVLMNKEITSEDNKYPTNDYEDRATTKVSITERLESTTETLTTENNLLSSYETTSTSYETTTENTETTSNLYDSSSTTEPTTPAYETTKENTETTTNYYELYSTTEPVTPAYETTTENTETTTNYYELYSTTEPTTPAYETTTENTETTTNYYESYLTTEPTTPAYETTTENTETTTNYYESYSTTEPTTPAYETTTENTETTTNYYESYSTTEPTTPAYETTTQDLYKISQDIYSAAQDLSTKANEISSITSDISSKISNINSMVSDLNSYDDDELSKKIQGVSKVTQEISSKTSEISSLCSTTSSLASDISSASSDMPSADRYHRFKTSPWQKMSAKCQDMVTSCQSIVTAAQDILLNVESIVSLTADLKVADAVSSGVYDVTAKTQLVISETLNIVSAVIELMSVIDG